VHLDVVGVAVVAVLVVDGQHVGVFVVKDPGETMGGLVDVGARERSRRGVGRFARHARVEVSEELDAVDAEHVGRGVEFRDPSFDELFARRERFGRVFAELAFRGGDEHDPMTLALGACHCAARGDRLVVGMRMKQDERVPHGGLRDSGHDAGPACRASRDRRRYCPTGNVTLASAR
jgi:hypothetical protein